MRYLVIFFVAMVVPLVARDVSLARDPNWTGVPLLGRQAAVLAFTDELLREVGTEEHINFNILFGNPDSLFDYLERNQVDAILSQQEPFPALLDHYAFSKPYLYTGPVLVVAADSKVDELWKMTGKILGVRTGSDARLIAAEVPLVVIEDYPSDAELLNQLAHGEIDGALIPAIPAYAFVAHLYEGALKIVTPPLTSEGIRMITLKDHHRVVEKFDKGLEKLISSSRYTELARKWQLHLATGPSVFGEATDEHR